MLREQQWEPATFRRFEESRAEMTTIDWKLLDANVEADRREWVRLWTSSPMQLPFAHPDFCRLLGPSDGRLFAASATDGSGHILYPFFLREIDVSVEFDDSQLRSNTPSPLDISSPYGYGGPLHWGLEDVEASAEQFWDRFDAWARRNRVISEFIRFSLFEGNILPYPGETRTRQANFVRDLDIDPDRMWIGADYKQVRQGARRAQREGVEIFIDDTGAHVDDFIDVYISTMERRESSEWYRFDRSFFDTIHTSLFGRFVYFYAQLNGRVVAASLVLLGADTAYGFLGGTSAEAFSARPFDMIEVDTMRWLHENGFRHYVIGGGLRAGDSLEFYKRKFAPFGEVRFRTGERILCRDDYDRLVEQRRRRCRETGGSLGDDEFFPAYRRGTVGAEHRELLEAEARR